MKVQFMYNGIKVDGKLYKASYSDAKLCRYPEGTITIYGKRYRALPPIPGLNVTNNSEIMTDYFENDSIRVEPDNPWYPQVQEACAKERVHDAAVWEKRVQRGYTRPQYMGHWEE